MPPTSRARTRRASGDDFGALIDAVEALQQRVCGEVKPGVDFVVLHSLTHRLLAALLRDHEIVKCSADEAVATGITRAFLPHGLGHLLGLQVHDAGGRQPTRRVASASRRRRTRICG